ncbi:hypothetical protein C0993_000253, partial [Termitomyces sp. T159_Od127]
MTKLWSVVLVTDWQWEVAWTLSRKQVEDEWFLDWANNLRKANDILAGNTCFHILADQMQDHLLLHCHDDVQCEYALGNKDGGYDAIKEFQAWIRMVLDIDSVITARKAQISKYIAHSIAASMKSHLKNITNIGKAGGASSSEKKGTGAGSQEEGMSKQVIVYPLTTKERQILNEHEGCYRCRKLYAGHQAATCPDGEKPLRLAEYETRKLMPEFAKKVKADQERKQGL